MAEIVGGFGVPHNPHFPLWVANDAPGAEEIERMYGGVAAHLWAVRPDVLLVFTADHYNMFFETCVPIFATGVADSAAGTSDYPQLPRRGASRRLRPASRATSRRPSCAPASTSA